MSRYVPTYGAIKKKKILCYKCKTTKVVVRGDASKVLCRACRVSSEEETDSLLEDLIAYIFRQEQQRGPVSVYKPGDKEYERIVDTIEWDKL